MKHIFSFNMSFILKNVHLLPEWLDHHPSFSSKERTNLKKQKKTVIKMLRRLRNRSNLASSNKLKSIQYKMLQSHSFIIVALLTVSMLAEQRSKKNGQKKALPIESRPHLEELANKIKSRSKLSKPIDQWQETKSDGSMRTVCEFDIVGQAQAQMAEWIFCTCSFPNSFDYCKSGKGTHNAVANVPSHIKNQYRYWVTLDIKHAFPSVRRGHLQKAARVSNYVSDLLLYLLKGTTLKEAAQPSLPQGIAFLPKILSAIVGQQLRQLDATKLVIMSYLDDILIGAQTVGELQHAIEILQTGFEIHSAGPLHFNPYKIVDLQKAGIINFLGYAVSVDGYSGEVRVRPNIMAFTKFLKELTKRLYNEYQFSKSTDNFLAIAHCYGKNWRAGFKLWNPNNIGLELFAASIEIAVTNFIQAEFNPKTALKTGYCYSKVATSAI